MDIPYRLGQSVTPGAPCLDATRRVALCYALVWIGVQPMVCLTVLFSTLTDNSARAVVSAVSVLFISYTVVHALQLDAMKTVREYWFTTHNDVWQYALRAPIEWGELARDASLPVAYAAAFTALALIIFARKDVKC